MMQLGTIVNLAVGKPKEMHAAIEKLVPVPEEHKPSAAPDGHDPKDAFANQLALPDGALDGGFSSWEYQRN